MVAGWYDPPTPISQSKEAPRETAEGEGMPCPLGRGRSQAQGVRSVRKGSTFSPRGMWHLQTDIRTRLLYEQVRATG